MNRFLDPPAEHPWAVILALLLTSLAAASQIHRLEAHVSPQGLTVNGDPAQAFYEHSVATFGSDNITLVSIRDPDLFDYDRLEAVRAVVDRLEALPFVADAESLFSVPHVRVVDEFVHTDPFLKETPTSPAQAQGLRKAALKNPFVRRNLLSDDGTAMAINVHLVKGTDRPEFDAEAVAGIEAAIAPLWAEVKEVFQVGLPYIRTAARDRIHQDQRTILPLAVVVLVITLSITLRRTRAAFIPLLTAGLSVLWTVGGMAALGIPLNVMTAIMPVLLIIVGSTEDIHLVSEYYAGTIAGHGRREAIRFMARRMGLVVLLTFLTSYLGFLAIAVNPIQLLRDFGLVASTGLAFNFLITATLVPVYLRFLGDRHPAVTGPHRVMLRERVIGAVSRLVLTRKGWVVAFSISLVAVAAYGTLSLLNSAVNESGDPELPGDEEVLSELTNFVKHRDVKEYVSSDFSKANIVVRHNLGSSYDLNQALAALRSFVDANTDAGLEVNITGESVLTSKAADRMAAGQAQSLGLMLAVIFTVISLLFVNAKAGLLAILPNLFPIVGLFGVMGYAGIPLDSGTSMIAAIALGICVDNTIHFMVRYNRELGRHRNETAAIQATMRDEATPVTAATLALALGLGAMVFSGFTPVACFGGLSAMVMLLSYYANFFITPIALSATRLITLWDLLSLDLRRELTHNCALFQGMRTGHIKRIILMGRVREYRAGEVIMRQGEVARELFILLEGQGEIRTTGPAPIPDSTRSIGTGHVFGVVALVCGRPRISTAVATQDAKVLSLTWHCIHQGARFYPRIAYQLFRNLSAILGARLAENVLAPFPYPGVSPAGFPSWKKGTHPVQGDHRTFSPPNRPLCGQLRRANAGGAPAPWISRG